MNPAVLLCWACVANGLRETTPFEGASALLNQIRSKADAMLSGFRSQGVTDPVFNESWFREKCDLSEYTTGGFDKPEYKVSASSTDDSKKWITARKCKNPDLGRDHLIEQRGTKDERECATMCDEAASRHKGEVLCCMYHKDKTLCEAWYGWQGMEDSTWGTNKVFTFFNRRTPKKARLIFSPLDLGSGNLTAEGKEMEETSEGQEFVKELIHQVNAVSIDGILDHLLSFYICMRWVPDEEFIRLAQFELEHVSVDHATPKEGKLDRDGILKKVYQASLTPLRCNSAINVQRVDKVDELVKQFNTTSELHQLYRFSENVWKFTDGTILNLDGVLLNEVKAFNRGLEHDPNHPGDSVFVREMRQVASKPENLPWMTFLRSSNDFDHHLSKSKNLFMLCFGPRVASFPHKRESGTHILADGNMAGCNGFWDWESMRDNLHKVKKLFAPEMCFEHTLRKELKDKFLATFIEMNEEFELAMQNRFAKRIHKLDPTQNSELDILADHYTAFQDAEAMADGDTKKHYKKIGGLLANAQAKWVICPKHPALSSQSFGYEDNFFRNPKAYEKWIGEAADDTTPQCKTYDPTTGCVKCVVAVLDEHRCHVRLNVKLDDVFKAIRDKTYPFLQSRFTVEEEVPTEFGSRLQAVTKTGACLVRKSVATAAKAAESGKLQDVKDAFFNVNSTDALVNLLSFKTPEATGQVESDLRFLVSFRKKAYDQMIRDGGVWDPNATEKLLGSIIEEQYVDKTFDWPKKYIFTHEEPERDNRPAHKVDYFMSCPCTANDFAPTDHFEQYGGISMGDYYSFR